MAETTTATPGPAAPPVERGARAAEKPALRGHMPALDGVRGLAILMVLLLHFIAQMEPQDRLERAISWTLKFGAYGVELFFVLSGFLITGILYDSRQKPHYFRNFYMRRFLRIFPLYYLVLALLFLVAPLVPFLRGPHLDHLRQNQAWAWLYGVNVYIALAGDWALSYIDHFWSLCVEEHFYFFWPLVVWLLARDGRRLMWVSLAISLGAMAARLAGYVGGLSWWTTYVLTPFRLDGLAMGGFLALLARQPDGPDRIIRGVPRAAALSASVTVATYVWVLVSQSFLPWVHSIRAFSIQFLLGALLMWALVAPSGSLTWRFFRSRTMAWLGTYSYGLYVYHHFISYYFSSERTEFVVAGWLGGSHLAAVMVQAVAGTLASAAIAWASYELVEKRLLALKRYFEPAR